MEYGRMVPPPNKRPTMGELAAGAAVVGDELSVELECAKCGCRHWLADSIVRREKSHDIVQMYCRLCGPLSPKATIRRKRGIDIWQFH